MELTAGERQSPLWRRLLENFEHQRDILRAKNDGPHDAATTADIRGRIAVYKALIALDNDPIKVS